ncbi:putative uncharacterized protein DDB_G0271982 [Capsicum annuum]|uniref:putative uncharacterized protein DDB_G0271982 n=1 Tax=Capsicum annuum TaxID=4072 RepID=UPI001FB0D4F3|nr:putative uncharacterized protein DDB_G0271982 [Capsicum annuum]
MPQHASGPTPGQQYPNTSNIHFLSHQYKITTCSAPPSIHAFAALLLSEAPAFDVNPTVVILHSTSDSVLNVFSDQHHAPELTFKSTATTQIIQEGSGSLEGKKNEEDASAIAVGQQQHTQIGGRLREKGKRVREREREAARESEREQRTARERKRGERSNKRRFRAEESNTATVKLAGAPATLQQ